MYVLDALNLRLKQLSRKEYTEIVNRLSTETDVPYEGIGEEGLEL